MVSSRRKEEFLKFKQPKFFKMLCGDLLKSRGKDSYTGISNLPMFSFTTVQLKLLILALLRNASHKL